MSTAMLAGSRIQLQQPAGLGGSRLQRAAAPVAAAARLGSVRPAGLQARSTAARRADRSALRVSATASPEAAPVKLSGDDLKEANRKHMRSVFDFDLWKKHRSSSRYLRHIVGLGESRIVSGLMAPLTYVMTLSLAVACYNAAAEAGYLPVFPELKLATNAPFGLTSFALSLLLVFRTNSSYGRWDEARKMWGLIVNRSRDFIRQGLGYIPPEQEELQKMLVRWTVAYSRSLMCHLRPGEDLRVELKDTLKPEELEALLASTHRPNYVVQVLTAIIKTAQLPAAVTNNRDSTGCVPAGAAYRMDENLTVFADVTGGCERILRTPIPLSYTRHTSRFMMIWLTLLPFTLWDSCHWAMLPIAGIVSFLLLGIEEIGVQIEEPFTILPLEVISRTIEGNVWELYRMHSGEALEKEQAELANGQDVQVLNAQDLVALMAPSAVGNTANGTSRKSLVVNYGL
ncbi:UPF0187 chloroplastic [Chlorella sorokiniana]|uniref:UPF0187 chloroplastic n=1 Tax=Chlorella sorokiniana TaxID=3076 RepID=A0A2P6THI5_CHLSO|nr:UPF0187 chloroplastic [Chlorella sorokiniana]|eukprot:PRW33726.1 UPF0187 chloroplastic [Chlorella sorokiniana]